MSEGPNDYITRIKGQYPGAQPFNQVVHQLKDELESKGYRSAYTRPATLMCVDCHVSHGVTRELDKEGFPSVFSLRQLAGYPRIEGEEGIGAYYHQLFNQGGPQAGLLIYAPHTAFTEEDSRQGLVKRKGREGHGKSCGARLNLLGRLRGEIPAPDPFYNRGAATLYEDFKNQQEKILSSSNPDAYQLELQYATGREQLLEMLARIHASEPQNHEILVAMGVQIDTDTYLPDQQESSPHMFQLRELAWSRDAKTYEVVYQHDHESGYY